MSFNIFYFGLCLLAASLKEGLGGAAGIIQGVGLVACFGGLIGATVSAMGERNLAGIKISLVIAAIGGLAWLIVAAFFSASGVTTNITPHEIN